MNSQLNHGTQPNHTDHGEYPPMPTRRFDESEELGFFEWFANLWEGRYFIFASLFLFVCLGGLYVWRTAPTYQAQALLQVEGRRTGSADPAFAKMEGLFSGPTEAQSEIEIIQSSLVLGRTVEALHLDILAAPKFFPFVGAAFNRGNPEAPRIEVESFDVPDNLRGQVFGLTALTGGTYRLESPLGTVLGTGEVGKPLTLGNEGNALKLVVRTLSGKPGQKFTLERQPELQALEVLRRNLDVAERGKLTNVLGLTLKCADPNVGAEILNEIVNQYVQHKIERKNSGTSQTLAILKEQLPQVKAKLDESENRLNQFRSRTGSVDLAREGDALLQQNSNLSVQISALQQKKQELLRTYREDSDVVATLNRQIAQLRSEGSRIDAKVRTLPNAQQEVVRLSRQVAINTELYTALLNNIQQLGIASAGEVGGITIVDPAKPDPTPIAPRKTMLMGLFLFLGLLSGVGLAILRKTFSPGIEDHRLIESKLGLPVLVTIPHSKAQEAHSQAMQNGEDGLHLLAALNPDDLATESLRSLRTSLHFSKKKASSQTVMVTGPSPGIGKSFVSGNLAVVLARPGNRVLVVDADLRKGSLHRQFWSRDRAGGLSDVLSRMAEWKAVVHKTAVPRLDLIMSGSIPMNPSELLMSDSFEEFLVETSKVYDYVILDAPPVLAVTDALIIGGSVDSVLVVAKYGKHPMEELRTCLKRLERQNIPVLGCVFNDVQPLRMGGNRTRYRYAYHYRYE
ncbi:polysaccharide biosynthesis tyrosine autokinase [Geothrix fuzhouensis]|uniref:polysaccharide biosynthesis tyrosine autokinase n=1 Tax=Geothrix fuzhouensis TaxID=2966451 RepID=UPI0021499802|nr:polysaccharide biosynthesis tyrosine autokinase [Geothrix fuzhouensis]